MNPQQLFKKHKKALVNTIEVRHCPLYENLRDKGVLPQSVINFITSRENSLTDNDQVRQMLDYLSRRPLEDYLLFRQAMFETHQAHVVEQYLPAEFPPDNRSGPNVPVEETKTGNADIILD